MGDHASGAPAVRQIADALASGEAISWDRADRLGRTPRERTLARELRTVAWLSTGSGAGDGSAVPSPRPAWTGLLERAVSVVAGVQVLVALAVVGVDAAITPALAASGVATLSCAAAAAVLARGRSRVRARMLGQVLLLTAALQARPLLEAAAAWPAPAWLRVWWQALFVEAFLPVALWRLALACPFVVRFTRFDVVSRGALAAATASSVLLATASARAALAAGPASTAGDTVWRAFQRQDPAGLFWAVVAIWAVVALATMVVRARQAAPREAQHVRLLLGALVVGAGTATAAALWRWLSPLPDAGRDPFTSPTDAVLWGPLVVAPWLLAAPALLHAGLREGAVWQWPSRAWLIARAPWALIGLATIASLVPVLHLVARPGEPLDAVLAESRVAGAVVVLVATLTAAAGLRLYGLRESLRRRRCGSHPAGVAAVATAVARARTPREVGAALIEHTQTALGTDVAAVLVPAGNSWLPIAGALLTVPTESAVSALLAAPGDPTVVAPRSHLFALLPAADRAWLQSSGVEVIARVTAPDGHALAALVIGGRRDGCAHSATDLAFVAAAVSTTAVAMEACAVRATRTGSQDAQADEQELAYECVTCGSVASASGVCACGGPRRLGSLPARLAGKFTIERRIGRGGMGVVYLATDSRLGRRVALKTLPRMRPGAAASMHAEARAMAAVEHPSVAVLYELEVWRDTPVLVVEYLAGGTLAARLGDGALPAGEAVALGILLADALADLHRRGWLHGDIKPSNIGLGRDGSPKLLDFGLTRLCARARRARRGPMARTSADTTADSNGPIGGTLLYLSPEVLAGRPFGEHAEVWALSLVLFEMVTGAHPFLATTQDEVLRRVRGHIPLDVRAWAPSVADPLAQVLEHALHPQRSRRIGTASALAAALRAVAAQTTHAQAG